MVVIRLPRQHPDDLLRLGIPAIDGVLNLRHAFGDEFLFESRHLRVALRLRTNWSRIGFE